MKSSRSFTAVVLAAGQGTRMKSALPKVLHPLAHLPLIHHVANLLKELACQECVLVTAPNMETVRQELPHFHHAIQDKPLGTGHAVLSAREYIKEDKDLLVLYGDTPLLTPPTIRAMVEAKETNNSAMVVLGMKAWGEYGRLIQNEEGFVERIVEHKDATPAEQEIRMCNSGIVLIDGRHALSLLEAIENKNQKKEFYLTDIVAIGATQNLKTICVEGPLEELLGVNSPEDLATAEMMLQWRYRRKFLAQGVRMHVPDTVYFSYDTVLSESVVIEPQVFFGSGVVIEKNVHIRAFSYLEGCHIGESSVVGPFARLRPGTKLKESVKIGNFVEVKNSTIGQGSKVSHLSYVGDAILGAHVNLGAGTITCNYDGYQKHKTIIEDDVFIGSNCSLVAPITLQEGALVAAGTTLTKDVEKDSLALSRTPQTILKNGASKFRVRHKKKD